MKRNEGITLIALVITIIVLVVLAGTTIATLTGDNGIITKAREATEKTEIAQIEEQLRLAQMSVRIKQETGSIKESELVDEFIKELGNQGNKVVKEDDKTITINDKFVYEITEKDGNIEWENKGTEGGSTTEPEIPEESRPSTWTGEVNSPNLAEGMTAVYWDNSNNENTLTSKNTKAEWDNWYTYKAGDNSTDTKTSKWANAKITKDGVDSYFVWIPRFEYKILSGEGTNTVGKIDVKFIPTTQTTADAGYTIHPAFQNGTSDNFKSGEWDSELAGIWVGKYETCHSDATASATGSSTTIKIAPNVQSWRSITIGDCYTTAYNYDRARESHLMKNSEWGAVAYLTHSQYGRNGNEIDINNSSTFITGNGGGSTSASAASGTTNAYNTATGMQASSTGNISGVYDLSGGVYEYVASYISNGNANTNGSSFALTTASANGYQNQSTKYATVYPYNSSSDNNTNNYNTYKGLKSTTYGKGDAILETSANGDTGNGSWFGDHSVFPYTRYPFFIRGGGYGIGAGAGVFAFYFNDGSIGGNYSFRVVLAGA